MLLSLKVGFLTEAVALCDEALRFENPHKNVGRTWTEAKESPDEENERLTKILAGATPISDFYRLLGRAEGEEPTRSLAARRAAEGAVTVEIKGSAFTAEGFYELHGLGGALGSTFGIAPAPSAVQKFRVAYRGTVRGRAIQGAVSRRPETDTLHPPSLLSASGQMPRILMFLTDDGGELKVMEQYEPAAAPAFIRYAKRVHRLRS